MAQNKREFWQNVERLVQQKNAGRIVLHCKDGAVQKVETNEYYTRQDLESDQVTTLIEE